MMTAIQIAAVAAAVVAIAIVLVPRALAARRARARKRCLSPPAFVGLEGWSETPLAPNGHVVVRGEIWEAVAESRAPRGARVRVLGAAGTRLRVSPLGQRGEEVVR
jgi:membrane-bound serine protease (ClpP class)